MNTLPQGLIQQNFIRTCPYLGRVETGYFADACTFRERFDQLSVFTLVPLLPVRQIRSDHLPKCCQPTRTIRVHWCVQCERAAGCVRCEPYVP